MSPRRPLLALVPIALLAACGEETPPEEGELSGEVLEGTISDEMLPLDQVRSRAPLAEPTQVDGGSPGSPDGAPDAEPAAEPAAQPAETDDTGE